MLQNNKVIKKNYIETTDGHSIYFENNGNNEGLPVVFLHGGPGSGCSESSREFFDQSKWYSTFFDQRGCGLSKPSGEIKNNNTNLLVEDIENIRLKLKIRKWVVFGGSWGSTLALKYAFHYPESVSALILRGIFLATNHEIEWFLFGLKRFISEQWYKFVEGIEFDYLDCSAIINHYHEAVFSSDENKAYVYANRWRSWEEAAMRLTYKKIQKVKSSPKTSEEKLKILSSMRIHLHYLKNNCFLEPNEIINNVSKIKNISTYIVQGGLDTICPPESAELLHKKMSNSSLKIVPCSGHGAYESEIKNSLLAYLDVVEKKLNYESKV